MRESVVEWLQLERYANEGTRVYSELSAVRDVPQEYDPVIGGKEFWLPMFEVRGQVSDGFAHELTAGECVFLPVHPVVAQSLFAGVPPCGRVKAIPLANVRTVYVVDGQPALGGRFVKLHYPRQLSRFVRNLSVNDARYEVEASSVISQCGLPVLRDLGYVGDQDGRVAALIRGSTVEKWDSSWGCMPLFALYGNAASDNGDVGSLLQRIPRADRLSPSELDATVVRPLYRLFAEIYGRLGGLPSLHGQNVLLAREGASIRGLGFRGCGVFATQGSLLAESVGVPPRKIVGEDDVGSVASLTFDGFIANHVLERVRASLESRGSALSAAFVDLARASFRAILKDALPWPEEVYYYPTTAPSDVSVPLILEATGRKPYWRS